MSKVVELYQTLQIEIAATNTDINKFANGNKAAGARVRKAMQNVKKLAQELRVAIQSEKNIAE